MIARIASSAAIALAVVVPLCTAYLIAFWWVECRRYIPFPRRDMAIFVCGGIAAIAGFALIALAAGGY